MRLGRTLGSLVKEEGLTLLELTVVAAILTLLAGLTAVGVSGVASESRAAAKATDTMEVQKAVEGFSGEHPQGRYPTPDGCLPGQRLDNAGVNPTYRCAKQPGAVATQEFTFNGETYVPLVWDNGFKTSEGQEKRLVPDYIARYPKHAFDRLSGGTAWKNYLGSVDIDNDGVIDYQVADGAGTLLAATELGSNPVVWVLDGTGMVHNLLPEGRY